MIVVCYGGPMDGREFNLGSHFVHTFNVPHDGTCQTSHIYRLGIEMDGSDRWKFNYEGIS